MKSICIFGIAGSSYSGKTMLIRKILADLKKQGLSVGVLRHLAHDPAINAKGNNNDHYCRAGADFVVVCDDCQGVARCRSSNMTFTERINAFPPALDLIIVDGYGDINMPGIWLETKPLREKFGRKKFNGRSIVFKDSPEYYLEILSQIVREIGRFHLRRPVYSGLLIGGGSRRMGTPKSLLKLKGITLSERSFDVLSSVSEKTVLLGSGQIPQRLHDTERLADLPDINGPLAGMLSAFRWAPESTWIISSVDMPLMNEKAWKWLLSQRTPGVWAVLPKIKGSRGVETTGALYEPMIFEHIESLAAAGITSLQEIAKHRKVISPVIPESLSFSWSNVNTPAEWEKVLKSYNRARVKTKI